MDLALPVETGRLMDLRPLSDLGAKERQLELCASCGHLRSQYPAHDLACWGKRVP